MRREWLAALGLRQTDYTIRPDARLSLNSPVLCSLRNFVLGCQLIGGGILKVILQVMGDMNLLAIGGYLLLCSWQGVQLFRIFKTKSAKDFSEMALWILALELTFMQFSYIIGDQPWVYRIGNGVSLVSAIGLLCGYYLYRNGRAKSRTR